MVDKYTRGMDKDEYGNNITKTGTTPPPLNVVERGALGTANAIAAPFNAAGRFVSDAYVDGLPSASGTAYRNMITGGANVMEDVAGIYNSARNATSQGIETFANSAGRQGNSVIGDIVSGVKNARNQFNNSAGIKNNQASDPSPSPVTKQGTQPAGNVNIADPTQDPANIDAQMAAAEQQLGGLDSITAQNAPTTSDNRAVNQNQPGVENLGIGLYKNTNLTAEEQKKYGKAIYSDSALGATTAGFDKQMAENSISTIETGGAPEYDYQAQAASIMQSLPYGTPGDRFRRQNLMAQADQLMKYHQQGIANQQAQQQYGIDYMNAARSTPDNEWKVVDGVPILDEDGVETGKTTPRQLLNTKTGQQKPWQGIQSIAPTAQDYKNDTLAKLYEQPRIKELVFNWNKLPEDERTPEKIAQFNSRLEELKAELEG